MQANATVIQKKSEIGLSFFPKYYVTVIDKVESSNSQHRVSKRTVMSTDIGNELSGFRSKGQFFTGYQLIIDLIHTFIFILVGILLLILGGLAFIKDTPIAQFINKWIHSVSIYWKSSIWLKYIIIISSIIFIFGGKFLHFYQINVKQHDKTIAKIIEVQQKPGYGRYTGPTFCFTLNYNLNDKAVETKIKVPKQTFDQYEEGNMLEVFYLQENPYYVFLPNELAIRK